MDKEQAKSALQDINLTEFAKRSLVPLRTLARIKAGQGSPNRTTLILLSEDLRRIKPEALKKSVE